MWRKAVSASARGPYDALLYGVGSASMDLPELRTKIDALDDEILRLLNERARLAGHVATVKEQLNVPFYVPSRERAIIERLMVANQGPFPNEAIRPVFQEIFSACLSLERKVRMSFLGPGTASASLAGRLR